MQTSLYRSEEVFRTSGLARESIETASGLLVACSIVLVLLARAYLVDRFRYRLLINFLALLACFGILVGAWLLVERATAPIYMFEMSYGRIVDDAPLLTLVITGAPLVLVFAVAQFVVRFRRRSKRE